MADAANSTGVSRRKLLTAAAALPVLAYVPATALAAPYTVEAYIADMEACGARLVWMQGAILQDVMNVDWVGFDAARTKAATAGITEREIYEALRPESKFTGNGWYAHKKPEKHCTVWHVVHVEGQRGGWYEAVKWPGLAHEADDIVFMTGDEVECFIHGPARI